MIGIWVLAIVIWFLTKDIRRIVVNKRGWDSPEHEYIHYTGTVLDILTLILLLYSYFYKISIMKLCIAIIHVRMVLQVFDAK